MEGFRQCHQTTQGVEKSVARHFRPLLEKKITFFYSKRASQKPVFLENYKFYVTGGRVRASVIKCHMGEGEGEGSKKGQKSVTYYLNGPLRSVVTSIFSERKE